MPGCSRQQTCPLWCHEQRWHPKPERSCTLIRPACWPPFQKHLDCPSDLRRSRKDFGGCCKQRANYANEERRLCSQDITWCGSAGRSQRTVRSYKWDLWITGVNEPSEKPPVLQTTTNSQPLIVPKTESNSLHQKDVNTSSSITTLTATRQREKKKKGNSDTDRLCV